MRYALNYSLAAFLAGCGLFDSPCEDKVVLSIQTGSGPTATKEVAAAICAANSRGDTKEVVRLAHLVSEATPGYVVTAVGAAAVSRAILEARARTCVGDDCAARGMYMEGGGHATGKGGVTYNARAGSCFNCGAQYSVTLGSDGSTRTRLGPNVLDPTKGRVEEETGVVLDPEAQITARSQAGSSLNKRVNDGLDRVDTVIRKMQAGKLNKGDM